MAIYCPITGSDTVYLSCQDCEYKGYCKDGLVKTADKVSALRDYMDIDMLISCINELQEDISTNTNISMLLDILDVMIGRPYDKKLIEYLSDIRKQVRSLVNWYQVS